MTIEEKARAYDKALKWMRELYPGLHGATKEDAEHYFPELRKSEDERVIRTLYYLVRDHDWVNGATKGEALAWLEKQKECLADNGKTSASEDERIRKGLIEALKASKTVGELKFVLPYPTREECIALPRKAERAEARRVERGG